MAFLTSSTLFESDLVRLRRVACRAPRSGCGPEEHGGPPRLVLPRRGLFFWHTGGRSLPLDPTVALLTGPGPFRVSHPIEGGDECLVLEVDEAAGQSAGLDQGARDGRAVRLTPGALLATCWLDRGLEGPGPSDRLLADETALLLFARVARDANGAGGGSDARTAASGLRRLLERVRALLAERFAADLSLADIGREVGRSPFQLAREARAAWGISLHQHRLRLRLCAALHRLSQGEADLSRLALECGFSSHSHLTSTFTRTFGHPPSVFREVHRRGGMDDLRTILKAVPASRS